MSAAVVFVIGAAVWVGAVAVLVVGVAARATGCVIVAILAGVPTGATGWVVDAGRLSVWGIAGEAGVA